MTVHLLAATLDAENVITIRLNRRIPVAEWDPARIRVLTDTGQSISIRAVRPSRVNDEQSASAEVLTAQPLYFRRVRYHVQMDDVGSTPVRTGGVLLDAETYGDWATELGCIHSADATTFRVFAPSANLVRVVVADDIDAKEVATHDMGETGSGIWEVRVAGDLAGRLYAFQLDGLGLDPNREVADPYARCMQGPHPRALILDPRSTDPPGFRDHDYRWTGTAADVVIYELHVRDYTIAGTSGIAHKGQYLGLAEPGTHLPADRSVTTGLEHLGELGVTHVQLMPVHDFDNLEHEHDAYDWGYMPVSFNSPDGWYASRVRGSERMRELKQAIAALHGRGIGVILDVVYNHTSSRSPFEQIVPGYYHRRTRGGRFANGSGCGNEFASEHPMARRFILDSLKYWVEEYRVDGFRFDLLGLIDLDTVMMIRDALRAIRPDLLLHGEPWTAGPTPLRKRPDHQTLSGTGVAVFNDRIRDAIKGDRRGPEPGFIQTGGRVEQLTGGLAGSIHDWTQSPVDALNYVECHDDLTAWDKLIISAPEASDRIRARMMRLASLCLLVSQGGVFLHAGQEFCRTKNGSPNSYNLPDEINAIDWSRKRSFRRNVEYARNLVAIRKAHPLLRLSSREQVERCISFPDPPSPQSIVYRLDRHDIDGEAAETLLVLLNGDVKMTRFNLPDGEWSILANANRADLEPLGRTNGTVSLPPHSGMLLMR